MCQILKMSYNSGGLLVEVTSSRDLTNGIFELYLFDFLKGDYPEKANIRQAISSLHLSHDSGIYRFKYEIPNQCKVKCVISFGEKALSAKERFIGDRYKIKVDTQMSEIGRLYKIKSDISVCKKLIFYKADKTTTKIHLPADLSAGSAMVFTIKNENFKPKFEAHPEFTECFNIEE